VIVIDGNDGIGKSTICATLQDLGYSVIDRGYPTYMTDHPEFRPGPADEENVYVILDAPVEVSRERLLKAGKDMEEKWHTVEALTHYRKRFQEVAQDLGVPIVDSSGTQEETLARVKARLGIRETFRVGVPKGRLFAMASAWMARAHFEMEISGRSYRPKCEVARVEPFILKPRSLPQMVAQGLLDAAICGEDLITESLYSEALQIDTVQWEPHVRLIVAAVNPNDLQSHPNRPLVIATEYPNIASRWMTERNLAHICINTYGSTEAWAPAFADLVLDVVETGQTLHDNKLTIIDQVMTSSTVVITRRGSTAKDYAFVRQMRKATQ